MKTRLGIREKKIDLAQAILALAVWMEILLWARMNLKYQYIFDYDASKLFYHVICMWKEKTLLIPDWVYMTTGEWDCASLPALLFYGLTGKIKLSFGLANLCNVCLFALVVSRVFKAIPAEHGRYKGMMLAISLLLMPYCWGMLEYSNMLFYGGAQYIYKVLLPVWLISLYVGMPSRKMLSVIWTAAFLVLVFATASSSGLYVFICGLFPVICCRIVRAIGAKRFDRQGFLISALTVIVFFAGFAFQKAANLTTRADAMMLLSMQDILPNAMQAVKDFLSVTMIVPKREALEIFTFEAFICYLKIGMLLVMLVMGFGELLQCFMIRTGLAAPEQIEDGACFVKASLASVFVWNLLILVLTETTPRYHLIGFVPFLILACIALAQKLETCPPGRLKDFLWTVIAAAVVLLAVMLFVDAREQVTNEKEERCQLVISEAERLDVQTVVILDDGWLAEEIRPLDPERDYVTYFSSEQKLVNYDVPSSFNDMSMLSGRHMLVTQDAYPFERLPDSMQQRYTLLKDEWAAQYYVAEALIEGE
ncbi:MAG: hypothetical protein ACI4MP_02280 [Candidatus Ventricola sp.]